MIVDNVLTIARSEISPKEWRQLQHRLTFKPDAETVVQIFRESLRDGYILPRGAWSFIPDKIKWVDKRSFPKMPVLKHNIVLDYKDEYKSFEGQKEALAAMFREEQGLVIRAPGTGKSNLGIAAAATFGTRTLILVHTEDILQQWVRYINSAIPDLEVGIVRQKQRAVGHITVATVQTLHNMQPTEIWWRQFGMLLVDECHRSITETHNNLINQSTARYRFGLSASETRSDGFHPGIELLIGPVIHRQALKAKVPVTVKPLRTNFHYNFQPSDYAPARNKSWQAMMKRLSCDYSRNSLIAQEVDTRLQEGRSVLVLSRRIDHLESIQEALRSDSVVLAAQKVSKPERNRILDEFREGKIRCVLATQLADEALDVPILDCVVLAYPSKHKDNLLQKVGRALRESPGKQDAIIIDVVDDQVRTLNRQWQERRAAYKSWGFKLENTLRRQLSIPFLSRKKRKVVFK